MEGKIWEMREGRVLLGGHRGDRKHFPENTMPSFRGAQAVGCDAIETDVRMTRDGHLVLIHDRDVTRTTNGHGLVDQMTLQEIKALDAGMWGEKIPTVEEFLDFVCPTELIVNWELKEYPVDLGEERAFECADRLVALIDQWGLADRSLMNSFSERVLEHIADTWPGKFQIHGYPHYEPSKDHASKPLEGFLHWAAIWRKDAEHPEGFQEDYDFALQRGLLPCILVPDEEARYRRAIQMGCRMFTSDDPAAAAEILKRLGCLAR